MNKLTRTLFPSAAILLIAGCTRGAPPSGLFESDSYHDSQDRSGSSQGPFSEVPEMTPVLAMPEIQSHLMSPVAEMTAVELPQVSEQARSKTPDVVYVPTPQPVVNKMLELVKLKKGDVIYDLGCGDGRIVVTAAKKYGVKAYGFDVDPKRVAEARKNVKKNKVEHLVTIEQRDIFELDLSPANVVTMYLLPELNRRLIPQLRELKPGSRIVSHDFDMKPIEPDQVIPMDRGSKTHWVYLWETPI